MTAESRSLPTVLLERAVGTHSFPFWGACFCVCFSVCFFVFVRFVLFVSVNIISTTAF